MSCFECVVVGLDGSEASARALDWVAHRLVPGGTIHTAHAVSPSMELLVASAQHDSGRLLAAARRDLHDWTAPTRDTSAATVMHVIEDDPGPGLIALARSVGADTIVVGSHGSGGGRSQFIGSVARNLIHEAAIPVIVHNGDRPEVAQDSFVLAGVGYGNPGQDAALWAARRAAQAGLPLVLLHVVSFRPVFPLDSPTDMLASYLGGTLPTEWAAAELEEIAEPLRHEHAGLEVRTVVGHGSAARAIVDAAEGAEIAVLGRREADRLTHRIVSSRIRQVVSGAGCPVAVVPRRVVR